MLANHTSIRHLFNHCLSQYDKLMKRKAFLDNYKVGALPCLAGPLSHRSGELCQCTVLVAYGLGVALLRRQGLARSC